MAGGWGDSKTPNLYPMVGAGTTPQTWPMLNPEILQEFENGVGGVEGWVRALSKAVEDWRRVVEYEEYRKGILGTGTGYNKNKSWKWEERQCEKSRGLGLTSQCLFTPPSHTPSHSRSEP